MNRMVEVFELIPAIESLQCRCNGGADRFQVQRNSEQKNENIINYQKSYKIKNWVRSGSGQKIEIWDKCALRADA